MELIVIASFELRFVLFMEDSPGWDATRASCFVNGYHDNRMNGGANFGRGIPRSDRGGRGSFRGTRGGGTFTQPMQSTSEHLTLSKNT